MSEFDLAVVGAGSGLEVAASAAGHGWSVAVIDEGPFGGTCLNRGCIPSKMLIHSADVMETIKGAHRFGINTTVNAVDWAAIVNRVTATIDEDARQTERGIRQSANMQVFRSRARFLSPFELQAGDEHVSARHLVIAAGSRPRVPTIEGIEDVPYLTSDNAMRLPAQPASLLIVGGGAVAVELAHFFGALGTAVTLIVRGDRLLREADGEVTDAFTAAFSRKLDVRLKREVVSVVGNGSSITASVRSPDGTETVEAEQLLLAAGRVPNTDLIEVGRAGVALDERGFVQTDDYLQTSVPGVWALGDIAGRFMLKHGANLEAMFVAHNLLHPDERLRMDYHAMPQAIFSSPQVAGVGETEQSLREQGRKYLVGRFRYEDTAFGASIEDHDGFVKVLADEKGEELLGCHIIGTDASVLIQEAVNAMRSRTGLRAITGSIYIHPALPEVVAAAASSLREPDGE